MRAGSLSRSWFEWVLPFPKLKHKSTSVINFPACIFLRSATEEDRAGVNNFAFRCFSAEAEICEAAMPTLDKSYWTSWDFYPEFKKKYLILWIPLTICNKRHIAFFSTCHTSYWTASLHWNLCSNTFGMLVLTVPQRVSRPLSWSVMWKTKLDGMSDFFHWWYSMSTHFPLSNFILSPLGTKTFPHRKSKPQSTNAVAAEYNMFSRKCPSYPASSSAFCS